MLGQLSTSIVAGLGELTTEPSFWLPRRGSAYAAQVDWDWSLVYWVSLFFFALITFLLFFFVLRFRSRPGHEPEPSTAHNTPLEIFWSIVPTLIVAFLFWSGYKTFLDLATPPENTYRVLVTGQKWNWLFTYPNGYVDPALHVPVDTAVQLVMTSQDVIHSLYIPEMRLKRDVIPGRYNKVWFKPVQTGEYDIFCAEYCGTNHSGMLAKLVVHQRADFEAWLEQASDFLGRMPPAEAGKLLYEQRGCKQCHSVNGAAGIGPTFLGLYGHEQRLASGRSVRVDENYLRESILQPQAQVAAGFEPVMPTYQGRLKDDEITAIIEYIKSLEG